MDFWVIKMHQCKFISCIKHNPLMGDTDDELCMCRVTVYEKSLYLPLSFAANLKLL